MRKVSITFLFVLTTTSTLSGCNSRSTQSLGFAMAAESKAAPDVVDAVRAYYTAKLLKGFHEQRELRLFFSPELGDIRRPETGGSIPEGVREAYAFYCQHVMDRDWGSASAYSVDAAGTKTYAVFVRSDGGDCWLEVFDSDGLLLGAARYDSGVTLWRSRSIIRDKVFSGDLEADLLQARQRRQHDGP
jgi:hypothetical protein